MAAKRRTFRDDIARDLHAYADRRADPADRSPPPWPRRRSPPPSTPPGATRWRRGSTAAWWWPSARRRRPASSQPGPAAGVPLPDRLPRARRGARPGGARRPGRAGRSTPWRATPAGRCTTASCRIRPRSPARTGLAARSMAALGARRSTRSPAPGSRSTACATSAAATTARATRSPAAPASCAPSWRDILASRCATRIRSSTASGRGRARPSWRCSAERST